MDVKLINDLAEIENGVGWKKCTDFAGKGDLVNVLGNKVNENYAGRKYKIIAKREKNAPPDGPKRGCCVDAVVRICSLVKDFFLWLLRKLHVLKPEQREIFYAILLRTSLPQNRNEKAACLFLKHFRGNKIRKSLPSRKPKPTSAPQNPTEKAACVFQKHFRGKQTRKGLLPRNLFPAYRSQCHTASEPNSKMKKALAGNTPVYLPQDMPGVVLKNSGKWSAIKRFHEMQLVRGILESQRSSHLVIPKARLCKDFLVEERLPINIANFHNMDLYINNPQLFDEPVREMTRLFSRGYLSDLLQYRPSPLGRIPGSLGIVRYDNIPFYLVEKSGKQEARIGLIDLEHFGLKKAGDPKDLWDLVRVFPYHLNIIQEEAQKLNYKITADLKLEHAATEGRQFLKGGYIDHLEWLRKKNLSKMIPTALQITPSRVSDLINLVEKTLLELDQEMSKYWDLRQWDPEFIKKPVFNENSKEILKKIAPQILNLMIANLNSAIGKWHTMNESSEKHLAESQVVHLRSPIIERSQIFEGVVELMTKNLNTDLARRCEHAQEAIGEIFLSVIFNELKNGGELFYFDPAYYTNFQGICWVRY